MTRLSRFVLLLICTLALIACDNSGPSSAPGTPTGAAGPAAATVKIQLNWKPEPQFGGFFAAQQIAAEKKQGVQLDVVAGGVGTPTIQMVAAGTVDFAVVSADEVILSRNGGNDVVALFAAYQTCPQGIMVHASRGLKNISDVFTTEGTVAMQSGLPYARFIEKKYGFSKVRIVPSPGGDLSAFKLDPKFAQQCFVTSEPIAAKRAGLDVTPLLVSEAGYNPYTTVLVTRGEVWKKNPDRVREIIGLVRAGWANYLADPAATNAAMQKLNPSMDAETFKASAEVQKPLIETEETKANGVGSMTRERWETLGRQLVELGVTQQAPAADQCFVEVK